MTLVDYLLVNRRRTALLGIASMIALLVCGGCGSGPIGEDGNGSLGTVMGKKTAELLGGHGTVVLLISEADGDKSEGLSKNIAALKKALGKSVQVSAVENLRLRPMPGLPLFPPQNFAAVLQKYATADALVSFVMLPMLPPAMAGQLPSPRPKVVSLVGVPMKNLFAQSVVFLAVQPKPAPDAGAKSRTAQEWFDARYQLITPETADSLPY